MEKDIILSIIIPVYNVEKYVDECLQSVINCKKTNYEIVVVNDGSTDNSKDICDKYRVQYDFINIINQDNKGLSVARNTGINYAKGKYLLFLDSDDFLKKDALNDIIQELLLIDKDVFFGQAEKYNDITKIIEKSTINYDDIPCDKSPTEIFISLNKERYFWFAAWLVIIRKKFLVEKSLYFMEGIYHEDELWVICVIMQARSMHLYNNSFYCYRINRNGSIISGKNIKREFDKLLIIDKFTDIETNYKKKDTYLIKNRKAALEWGLVLNYYLYKNYENEDTLCMEISKRTKYLRHGKYFVVYIACRLFGVKLISKLYNKCTILIDYINDLSL